MRIPSGLKALLAAKARAFGVHLVISAALFALIIAVAIARWLPPPYFWIDGGMLVVGVAAVIDVVLGPAFTFWFYRPARRGLVAGFVLIAFVQAAALTWGVKVLYDGRPLVIAYVGYPRLEFFPLTELLLRHGKRSIEELEAMSSEHPPLVLVPMPSDRAEARAVAAGAALGKQSVLRQSENFRRLEGDALAEVLAAGRTRAELESTWPGSGARVDDFLAAQGRRFEEVALVPVYGRYGSALLAFDRAAGRLIGHVTLYAR